MTRLHRSNSNHPTMPDRTMTDGTPGSGDAGGPRRSPVERAVPGSCPPGTGPTTAVTAARPARPGRRRLPAATGSRPTSSTSSPYRPYARFRTRRHRVHDKEKSSFPSTASGTSPCCARWTSPCWPQCPRASLHLAYLAVCVRSGGLLRSSRLSELLGGDSRHDLRRCGSGHDHPLPHDQTLPGGALGPGFSRSRGDVGAPPDPGGRWGPIGTHSPPSSGPGTLGTASIRTPSVKFSHSCEDERSGSPRTGPTARPPSPEEIGPTDDLYENDTKLTTSGQLIHPPRTLQCATCHIAGREEVTSLPDGVHRYQITPGGSMLPSVRGDGTHRLVRSGPRRAAQPPNSTWLSPPARRTRPATGGSGATRSSSSRGRTGDLPCRTARPARNVPVARARISESSGSTPARQRSSRGCPLRVSVSLAHASQACMQQAETSQATLHSSNSNVALRHLSRPKRRWCRTAIHHCSGRQGERKTVSIVQQDRSSRRRG